MKLANLKIAQRLALGFGALCLILVAIQTFSINMLGKVNEGTADLVSRRVPNIIATNTVMSEVNDVAIAVRNMILSSDPADRRKQLDEIATSRKLGRDSMDRLRQSVASPAGQALVERMTVANERYIKGQDEMIARINAGDEAETRRYLKDVMRPALAELKQAVNALLALQISVADNTARDAQHAFESTRTMMIVLAAASLALAALIAWWNTRSITRPMARALEVANTVAAGDLTSRIEVTTMDETGQLLQALKTMNESLVRTVITVRSGTETIATASSEVAAGSLDLSARTEQQAGSLEETASSMEELTSTVKQNADNAHQAKVLAEAASTVAERGGRVIGDVVGTMDLINSSAGKIADIIGVIDVVASEVRNLAQRSAAAAKEIKGLIGDSTQAVQAGGKLVGEAGATMQEIVESVRRVTDIMSEISAASVEQTAGIEQINEAITQMDQVTQQNAALVEQAAAASASMQEQAANLTRAVSVFQVAGDAVAAPVKPAAKRPAQLAMAEPEWQAV
jgi:methyl-accepting chemotaxis protein